jgi:hypothetical protein
MSQKINPKAFAYAGAIISAFVMLILGVLGHLGIYTGAVQQMHKWHMFFSLNILGIIAGMVESAVISFVLCYVFAWLYNKFLWKTHLEYES